MPIKKNLLPAAMAAVFLLVAMPTASAVVYYWDGNGTSAGAGTTPNGTWGSSAFWSVNSSGTASTFNNSTTALDQLRFSAGTDATGTYTVTVSGTQTARQLSLEYGEITFSGGTINLSSNATASSSDVGTGIVLATTAGNATISSNLTIDGIQMLNIAAGKTLTLNTGTFTRNAGSSLNVLSTGTVTSTMTGLNSGGLVNGIVGPWATYGTGTSTRYATFSGDNIVGLTGTSAATAANVTDTGGTFNYDVAAVGALGAGASVNTLRYTGAAGTISGDLTTNGLLNAGTGAATLSGNITIGSTRELVVTPAAQSFTISGVLRDNALGASSLLVTQLSTNSTSLGLTLSNNNTYSGGTTVSNARLSISANNALGTGAVSVLRGNVGNATFAGSVGNYGGLLDVSGNITWSNNMTLAGQGLNSYSGALRNSGGNNTHTGTITIADANTRISSTGGTLFLNGNINLTTATSYSNLFNHSGGDIRLGGNITGSATSFQVIGGGSNFLILDRAFAWGNSTGLSLGSSGSTSYGRVDLNGNNQTVTSLATAGTDTTQNLITNRSGTLASFTINNTSNFNANPTFSGNLVIVKNGGGQATMSSVGTHTGGWIINNGTLSTGSAQTFGTGNITINSGGNATIGLNAGTSSYSNNFSIAGSGSGNGALQSNTSGNYTFSGAVALTGDATLGSRATSGSGGGLIFTGGISTGGVNRTLTLNTFGGTSGNNTLNTNFISLNSTTNLGTGGTLTMGNGIVAGGTGTYNINVGGNTWGTSIVQGLSTAAASSNATLNLGAANALGSSSSVLQLGNFNTALENITVNLNGNNQTIGGLRSFGSTGSASANGTRTVTSATAATLTIDNSSATNYLYDGAISGAISLVKNGTATQTLSGVNTYTGTTTINGGVLTINSTSSLPGFSTNGSYSVANGATLAVSNAVTDADIASMLGTSNFAAGGAIGFDTSTARTYSSNITNTSQGALGLTKLGSNTLTLFGNNSYTGTTTINAGILAINGNSTTTLSGLITGAGQLRQSLGSIAGSLTLNNDANDFTGRFSAEGANSAKVFFTSIADYGTASALGKGTAGTTIYLSNGWLVYTGAANSSSNRTWTSVNSNQIQNNGVGVLNLSGDLTHDPYAAARILTFSGTNTGNNTFSGSISQTTTGGAGTLNLTKSGAGYWTLSGNNSYNGNTTVSGGILQFAKTASLYNGTTADWTAAKIRVSSGGTLAFNVGGIGEFSTGNVTTLLTNLGGANGGTSTGFASGSNIGFDTTNASGSSFTIADIIANSTGSGGGAIGVTKLGAGTIILTGANTYTGATTVGTSGGANAGTLQLSGVGRISTAATTIFGGTLDLNGTNQSITTLAVGGGASGSTAAVTTGSGTLTLGGNVDYSATNNANGASISGNLDLGGATRTFTIGDSSAAASDLTVGAVISNGTLTKAGAGTLALSGANTYTGATTINAGTLSIAAITNGGVAGALGNSTNAAGNLTLGGGTLEYTGSTNGTTDRNFTLTAATTSGISVTNSTVSLTISGTAANTTGALTKDGLGTLILSGDNTYTGTTTINAGTLQLGHANALGATSSGLVVNGTLDLNGNSITKSTLSGETGNISSVSAATLTFNRTNAAIGTYNGTIGGNVALSITNSSSSGTATLLTLGGSNTYTGNTTIYNSSLSITNGAALGNSTVIVRIGGQEAANTNYGGQIRLSGDNITVSNNMTLAGLGYGGFNGAFRNNSGNNTYTGTITISASETATRITSAGGSLSLNGTISLGNNAAYTGLFQHGGGDIRLGGNGITGSPTSFNVLGGGSNFLITDRANAWGNSTGLSLGSSGSTSYGRVDLNGFDQTITSLTATGTDSTQNLITNRSGTLATLTINNTSNFSANPTFSGNLVIVKNGGGQATISSVGTHTGGWIINNGTLSTGSAQTFGTGNVTINSGGNATLALNFGTSSYSNNFSIAGSGSGNGALQSNTSGNYTISGAVALTGDATLGSRATSGSGAGLIFTGGISTGGVNRTLTLNTFGGTSGNTTVNTNFISLNSATNLGTGGTLTMGNGLSAGGTGTYNINVGGNTWGTTIVQGLSTAAASTNTTLNLGAANALGSSSSVLQLGNFNTALENITVNLNGNNQTIGGLRSFGGTGSASANGTRTVTSATAATLTIDNSSGTNYLFDGAITGNLSLVKNGTATQTLSGNNTYTGATTINGGTLIVGSLNSSNTITVNSGGTLGIGNSAGAVGTLTVGSLTLNGGSTYALDLPNTGGSTPGTDWDLLNVTGVLSLNATAGNQITIALNGSNAPSTTKSFTIFNYGSLGNTWNSTVFNITNNMAGSSGAWSLTDSGTSIGLTYTLSAISTWTGASGNWSSGFDTPPTNNAALVFSGAGGTATNNIASGSLSSLTAITINSTAGSCTLNASSGSSGFDVSTPLSITGVTNNSANATTVNLALAVNSSPLAINAAAGNITMGGPIANNNVITFSGANGTTVSGAISGTGAINKDGTGTLTLTGSNSYNGTTTINAGVLNIRHSNALGNSIGGTIVGNATALQLQGNITVTGEQLTLSGGGLSGSNGALRSTSGNNTWAGDITILGTVDTRLQSDSGSLLTINGNIITASSKPVFQGNGNITVSGIISGSAAVATASSFPATSVLTLSGNNTFTGQMQINSGIVRVSSIKNFGVASGLGAATSSAITIGIGSANGTLLYTGAGDTSNRTIQIGTNSGPPASTDTGSATIQNDGSGALVFNAANFNTATNASSGNATNRTLTLSGSNTGSNTISGVIRDNIVSGNATGTARIGLIKSGAGTWVLSGTNTYTGATSVNAGTLLINGSTHSSSAVTVANGATLGGSGTINGATTINGNLVSGDGGVGVLTFGSSLVLNSPANISFTLNGTTRGTNYNGITLLNSNLTYGGNLTINVTSAFLNSSQNATFSLFSGFGSQTGNLASVSLSGAYGGGSFAENGSGAWNLADSSGNQWSFDKSTGNLAFAAIPEPSAYALLLTGLAAMAILNHRRRKARVDVVSK